MIRSLASLGLRSAAGLLRVAVSVGGRALGTAEQLLGLRDHDASDTEPRRPSSPPVRREPRTPPPAGQDQPSPPVRREPRTPPPAEQERQAPPPAEQERRPPPPAEHRRPVETAPEPGPAPAAPPPPLEPQLAGSPTADHLDVPEELVAERADPGAVDGAGAQLHVEEPWEGYGRLAAADVIDRLTAADASTLAVVELYENTHRRRRTVLAAVRRRRAAPGGEGEGQSEKE